MDWEFAFLDSLDIFRSCAADAFFGFITHLGDKGAVWIALGILLCFFKKTRKAGVCVLVALLFGAFVGNLALKPIFARQRPFDVKDGIYILINAPKDFSFPSGHTLSSFSASTAVFLHSKKYGALCYALAFLIAFSRLYFYVHYPTDVIAGLVLGLVLGYLAVFTVGKINFKQNHQGD